MRVMELTIKRGQIWATKKPGRKGTEYRLITNVQLSLNKTEDCAEIITTPCDERGILFTHKKKYQSGKSFKARFKRLSDL